MESDGVSVTTRVRRYMNVLNMSQLDWRTVDAHVAENSITERIISKPFHSKYLNIAYYER